FSINQLSLFAMVLAIGIVVDDAIVVVEAVERIMREEQLPPKEATRKAMRQITGAIVAITSVLAAVFIPSALQTGSTGVIYRQFALTIALSMGFSALLALSFTPALCASLLRPGHLRGNVVFDWFNRAYEGTRRAYVHRVFVSVAHVPRWMAGFAAMLAVGVLLFLRLPGSFLPDEDQGYTLVDVQLPAGASLPRTREVLQHINAILTASPDVSRVFLIAGSSFTGTGENAGRAFIKLKPWDERPDKAADFIRWANEAFAREIHDAKVYALNLPTVRGLGVFGGFDLYLEDRGGLGREALAAAQSALLDAAARQAAVTGARANLLPPAPQLRLTVDRVQAQSMGLSASDVYTALQLMLAPVYANDFVYQGRVLRVLLQADASWRMTPEALGRAGADAVRALDPGRVPLPRRTLRELEHSGRGADGRARGPHRQHRRGVAARPAERRVLQGRAHHYHRAVSEECDPDRGIRRHTAARGPHAAPSGAGGRAAALPADPHDLLRIHPRGLSHGDLDRRGRQRPPRHRHRGRRRDAERAGARGALDPGVLRCRAAAHRGQAR